MPHLPRPHQIVQHLQGLFDGGNVLAFGGLVGRAAPLLIEVHSNPECALCDGEESIKPTKFKELMHDLKKIAEAVGREI